MPEDVKARELDKLIEQLEIFENGITQNLNQAKTHPKQL